MKASRIITLIIALLFAVLAIIAIFSLQKRSQSLQSSQQTILNRELALGAIAIEETTVARINGLRIGAANFGEGEYQDSAGNKIRGLTGSLFPQGKPPFEAHPGMIIDANGKPYQVHAVWKGKDQIGWISLLSTEGRVDELVDLELPTPSGAQIRMPLGNQTAIFLGPKSEWSKARVEYDLTHVPFGSTTIKILGSGLMQIRRFNPSSKSPEYDERRDLVLSKSQVRELFQVLVDNNFLALNENVFQREHPSMVSPLPPEPIYITLTLQNSRGEQHQVKSRTDTDFNAKFYTISKHLEALINR